MNLRLRGIVLIFVVGLAIIVAGLQTPAASSTQNVVAQAAGSGVNQVYFFQPMTLSISISQLQGGARLLVLPVNYDASLETPIVNVPIVAQDIVTFSVPSRGYYSVAFFYANGSIPALSYVIDESGTPPDILTAGIVIAVIGGILFLIMISMSRRKVGSASVERTRVV